MQDLIFFTVLLGGVAIPLILIWRRKRSGGGFLALCALAILLMSAAIWRANTFFRLQDPFNVLLTWVLTLLAPALAVICAAYLLAIPAGFWRSAVHTLIAAALVVQVGVLAFFFALWDVATDGLFVHFMTWPVNLAVLFSALALLLRALAWRKGFAIVLFAGVLLAVNGGVHLATYAPDGVWGRMPALLTERSAASIQNAILRYHERTGGYPAELRDLTPRELLILPRQYILPGREWCYAGTSTGYQFGYLFRDNFGLPAVPKIVGAQGFPPGQDWNCPAVVEVGDALD